MDTLTLPSLLSQLKVAISSARERSDESLQFHATFFHRHENKVRYTFLFNFQKKQTYRLIIFVLLVQAQDVLMIWKGICFGDSKYLECPPADTLHFLLMIESIWFSAALICIEHIHSNHINGRTALYCISEIRLALNRLVREVTTKREINCMINNVQKLGEACIEPIMNSGSINANSFSSCLELLPTIADALHHLQRQLDDFATDFDDSDPLDDLICTIFLVEWDLSLLLPLSSILCELYSYLSKDNLVAFKVSVQLLVL